MREMFRVSLLWLGAVLAVSIALVAPVWPDTAGATNLQSPEIAGSDFDSDNDQDDVWRAQKSGDLIPFPRILDLAAAKIDGGIIATEFRRSGDRVFYVFKFIDRSGHVRELALDARTGAALAIGAD
jgi:uncharacterized membrane protein YkoI